MIAKSIKDNISLAYIDNKVEVVNLLEITFSDDEESSSFFASVDSNDEKVYLPIALTNDELIYLQNNDWFHEEHTNYSFIDSMPNEMQEVVAKGLKSTSGFFLKTGHNKISDKQIIDYLRVEDGTINSNIELLNKAKKDFVSSLKKFKSGTGNVDLSDIIDRYMFKKHLLVRGKKGVGKTYQVDKRLKEDGIAYDFIAGHEGMESIDLLGYYVKDETGNLVWLDGALAQAFRKAQSAKHAIFFDEIGRMPSRELNILVGALTPSSSGTYRLRTNRIVGTIDGIGETELIEVPVENLWLVATTNVGAGYDVDEFDEAFIDRVRIVDKISDGEEINTILNSYMKPTISATTVTNLVTLYTEVNEFVATGELEKEINLRHMCEVIQFSEDDDDIKVYLNDLIPTWCTTDTNGSTNKSEREIIQKLIKRIFK